MVVLSRKVRKAKNVLSRSVYYMITRKLEQIKSACARSADVVSNNSHLNQC